MGKKYWWLKLPEDFFRQLEIKKLRRIAGGDTYTIIYLKMMLLSLKTEGCIAYDCEEDDFIENLALDIDEDEDNVGIAVAFLIKNGLLQTTDKKCEKVLPKAVEAIGSETAAASRMREMRERKKAQESVTMLHDCYKSVTPALRRDREELELDIDLDKDTELQQQQESKKPRKEVVVVDSPFAFWEKNMGAMTEYIAQYIQALIADYGEVTVLEGMQIALKQGKRHIAYVEGCCKNIHAGATKPESKELLF